MQQQHIYNSINEVCLFGLTCETTSVLEKESQVFSKQEV